MRYKKVPEPEKKGFYSSPIHPAVYKLELNHSSQRFIFRYSVIETSPQKYESGLSPGSLETGSLETGSLEYTDIYPGSGCSDLPAEVDITMEAPDIYLECTGSLSESSDIQQSVKKK